MPPEMCPEGVKSPDCLRGSRPGLPAPLSNVPGGSKPAPCKARDRPAPAVECSAARPARPPRSRCSLRRTAWPGVAFSPENGSPWRRGGSWRAPMDGTVTAARTREGQPVKGACPGALESPAEFALRLCPRLPRPPRRNLRGLGFCVSQRPARAGFCWSLASLVPRKFRAL